MKNEDPEIAALAITVWIEIGCEEVEIIEVNPGQSKNYIAKCYQQIIPPLLDGLEKVNFTQIFNFMIIRRCQTYAGDEHTKVEVPEFAHGTSHFSKCATHPK